MLTINYILESLLFSSHCSSGNSSFKICVLDCLLCTLRGRFTYFFPQHDTTLAALQTALNVYNGKQPPYASCHIFELYQEDDGWGLCSGYQIDISTQSQLCAGLFLTFRIYSEKTNEVKKELQSSEQSIVTFSNPLKTIIIFHQC